VRAVILLLALGACKQDLLADLPDAAAPQADACVASASHTIYINREPTSYSLGSPSDSAANVTSIIPHDLTTLGVGQVQLSASSWRLTEECLEAKLAAYDVEVVSEDPGDVDHWELVVTHDGTELDMPAGAAGLAHSDCPSSAPRELSFAFWQPFALGSNWEGLCEMLAWEVGIMAGLSPSVDCRDVLGKGSGTEPLCQDGTAYLDETLGCATSEDYSPGPCRCGGSLQNSHEVMTTYFGPNTCL
jgi:hypothetical protein